MQSNQTLLGLISIFEVREIYMKKLVYYWFLLACLTECQLLPAQATASFSLINQKEMIADRYWGTDGQGQVYYSLGNTFYKQTDRKIFQYTTNSLGTISRVDVLNPMRILLFFESANTAIQLDNQLNEMEQLSFSTFETPLLVRYVGQSAQNKLWVFDSLSQHWGLFDPLTNQFRALGLPIREAFRSLGSDFNSVYWLTTKGELFQMDVFGKTTQIGNLPSKYNDVMLLTANQILYKSDQNWLIYWANTGISTPVLWNENQTENAFFYDQNLTIFTHSEWRQYQFKTK